MFLILRTAVPFVCHITIKLAQADAAFRALVASDPEEQRSLGRFRPRGVSGDCTLCNRYAVGENKLHFLERKWSLNGQDALAPWSVQEASFNFRTSRFRS